MTVDIHNQSPTEHQDPLNVWIKFNNSFNSWKIFQSAPKRFNHDPSIQLLSLNWYFCCSFSNSFFYYLFISLCPQTTSKATRAATGGRIGQLTKEAPLLKHCTWWLIYRINSPFLIIHWNVSNYCGGALQTAVRFEQPGESSPWPGYLTST